LNQVMDAPADVMIDGETGTGKELVARALHDQSNFHSGPLVSVNCSTFPEALIESLLFGHEKGAFTGADKKHSGYFAQADQGTLFLDELGEMSLSAQAKLLRVLESGRYTRVGGTTDQVFNGRIVAATHVDLKKAMAQREFREDLYYRLNVLTIEITPLRERREDIPLLIEHLLTLAENPLPFTPAAIAMMQNFDWAGNVRELKNAVERLCLLSNEKEITPACLEEILDLRPISSKDLLDHAAQIILDTDVPDKNSAIINALLIRALKKSNGNKSEAAKLIGVHRKVVERRFFSLIQQNNPTGAYCHVNESN